MALYEIVESLPELIKVATDRNDDDFYDRLSSRYTVAQLILFAIVVTAGQIIEDPVTCWVPAYYHGSWEEYTNSYCWVRNTYYVPWHEEVPLAPENSKSELDAYKPEGGPERGTHTVTYYQWVPIFLLFQAIMFFAPCFFWRSLNHRTGIDLNMIIETAEELRVHADVDEKIRDAAGEEDEADGEEEEEEVDEKKKILNMLTNMTRRYLGYSKKTIGKGCCGGGCNISCSLTQCGCCGRRQGNYMSVLYMFIKALQMVNVVGQYFLLAAFLGDAEFHTYGFRVARAMARGEDWTQLSAFPRVTYCDIVTRRLGNNHRYTVQCTLYMNLLNEKIFFYLWWWFLIVFLLSAFSFVRWTVKFFMRQERYLYVKRNLINHDRNLGVNDNVRNCLKSFVDDFLQQDGHLALRLVDLNTNKMILKDLVGALWDSFKNDPKVIEHFNLDGELGKLNGGGHHIVHGMSMPSMYVKTET